MDTAATIKRPTTTAVPPRPRASDPRYGDLSILMIAKRCGLDRATTKKRLDLYKYEPVVDEPKLKLYRFDADMEARLLETDTKLSEAKTRQTLAAAQLAEIKVEREMGTLAPVEEFKDVLNQIFGAMYQETAVRLPQRISAKLHKAKSPKDVHVILAREITKIFTDLRGDHPQFLTNGKGNGTGNRKTK